MSKWDESHGVGETQETASKMVTDSGLWQIYDTETGRFSFRHCQDNEEFEASSEF